MMTRDDMDSARCMNPGCVTPHPHTIVLGGRCHPGQPVVASFSPGDIGLTIRCAICEALIMIVEVAKPKGAEVGRVSRARRRR